MKFWHILAGFYLCYCWGVVAFYIESWGTKGMKFVDRIAYALKWPLMPLQAPFVFLYIIFMNKGTLKQKAEAAQRLMETEKPEKKPSPKTPGGDYVQ